MRILKIVSEYPMKRVESIYRLLILDYNLFGRMWNRGYQMRGGRLYSRDTRFWCYGQKLYVQLIGSDSS